MIIAKIVDVRFVCVRFVRYVVHYGICVNVKQILAIFCMEQGGKSV